VEMEKLIFLCMIVGTIVVFAEMAAAPRTRR
jgi:hypothetical protein